MVSVLGKVLNETVLGHVTGLFETQHSLPNLHVEKTTVFNTFEIIFDYSLIGDDHNGDAHVFVGGEGGAIIEFSNVYGADGAVEEEFDGGDSGACGKCITGVLKAITASSDTHAIIFFLGGVRGMQQGGRR